MATYPIIVINQDNAMHHSGGDHDMGSQTGNLRINVKITPSTYTNVKNKFLLVSLQGSEVMASNTGRLQSDEDNLRAWYLDLVEVWISIPNSTKLAIEDDAPTTTEGSKSTTSSTNFSLSASAGVFGTTPTGNIGAGLSIGNSFTVNLTDFKVQNLSDNARVYHKYLMASSSGGSYDKPEDLMDSSVKGQFSGTKLFDVPDLAKCNMPLASQAIFMTTPDDVVNDVVRVEVRVKVTLRLMHKKYEVVKTEWESKSNTFDFTVSHDVDLSQYKT